METEIFKNLHKMLTLLLTTVFQWEVSIDSSAVTIDKYVQGKKNRLKCWQTSCSGIKLRVFTIIYQTPYSAFIKKKESCL